MAWDNILHKKLRDICAYLWEDARDCRRLVADALIDAKRINWDEPPTLRWQSVIMECEKQGTLDKLCPVLLKEYPENTPLREAVAPWMDNESGEGERQDKPKPKPEPLAKVPRPPLDYDDLAGEIPITLESIRADLAWITRQINEIRHWRRAVAVAAAKDRAGEEDEDTSNVSVSLPLKKGDDD